MYVYGEGVMNVSNEEWKKLRNKKDVKNAIKYRVVEYLKDLEKTFDFVPAFAAIVNTKLNTNINIRTSMTNYKKEEWLIIIPLYLIGNVANIINNF